MQYNYTQITNQTNQPNENENEKSKTPSNNI